MAPQSPPVTRKRDALTWIRPSVFIYARDWSDAGAGLLPKAGDQFMITQHSDGDYVVMTLNGWCAGQSWHQSGDASCGGSDGHPGYGSGVVTRGTANTNLGAYYFNGCSHVGGCSAGAGDGAGFSTHSSWSAGDGGGGSTGACFGGCHDSAASGSPLHWAGSMIGTGNALSFWFRGA